MYAARFPEPKLGSARSDASRESPIELLFNAFPVAPGVMSIVAVLDVEALANGGSATSAAISEADIVAASAARLFHRRPARLADDAAASGLASDLMTLNPSCRRGFD